MISTIVADIHICQICLSFQPFWCLVDDILSLPLTLSVAKKLPLTKEL